MSNNLNKQAQTEKHAYYLGCKTSLRGTGAMLQKR